MDQDRHPKPAPRDARGAPPPAQPHEERHPAPDITIEPGSDAENLIPIDDRPGTF